MAYEVDFLGVGEEQKSGDAIAIRFGDGVAENDPSNQTVVIIDGGFKDDGEKLVNHVKTHFNTDVVDLVISTHPDQDHINGLFSVIEELDVKRLWIKKPWEHDGLSEYFKDGRVTDNSINERLTESLNKAVDLVTLAEEHGIEIIEPFCGEVFETLHGSIRSLGPSVDYYHDLIPEILDMESSQEDAPKGLLGAILEKAVSIFRAVWGEDDLDENGKTSALNSTSVITLITIGDASLLFTGDAGIDALNNAHDDFSIYSAGKLSLFQIPHHGSRRNLSSSVLDKYIGPPLNKGDECGVTAIASTAKKGAPKHPRQAVLNALIHRGAKVLHTKGNGICHRNGVDPREGWSSLPPEEYVEEYEK